MRQRRVPWLSFAIVLGIALVGGACSGDSDEDDDPDCPPSTTEESATTTTVDPRCVQGAEEQAATTTTAAPTDETWEGEVDSTVTVAQGGGGPCPNPTTVSGTVHLTVDPDGAVSGTYDVTGCGVSEPHAEFTGTETDDGFTFPQLIVFTNGELIPKVNPDHAEAVLTNVQGAGAATWVTAWDLRCVTC